MHLVHNFNIKYPKDTLYTIYCFLKINPILLKMYYLLALSFNIFKICIINDESELNNIQTVRAISLSNNRKGLYHIVL